MDVSQADERWGANGRTGLMILWLVALVTAAALAAGVFAGVQNDWQFNEAARGLDGLSFEALTALVGAAQLSLTGLMLLTSALLLSRRAPGARLAALALMALPFTFNLVGAPWSTVLGAVAVGLGAIGVAGLLLLLFLFPDGHFYPSRLRVPALLAMGLVVAGIVLLQFVEDAWLILMLLLFATLLLGLAGQVWRYRAAADARRRSTAGFLLALVALPFGVILSATSFSPLLNLVADYVLLALLPAGLLYGVARGLWGGSPAKRTRLLFAGAGAAWAVVSGLAAFAWLAANRPPSIDPAALAAAEPVAVLVDADMAMDDLGALLFLMQHPAVDLRAITVNGVAFAHCDAGVRIALGLLEVARAPQTPVACGHDTAYPGGQPAPDAWRASADRLYGAQVSTGERAADPRPAAALLADTIAAAPGQIVVIAIGPLTNLAEAFRADPTLPGKIRLLVIMGGALDVPGNVANEEQQVTNQVAEWNFFADPLAADIVLASGAPILLVPLDATNGVPFTRSFYRRLGDNHTTRAATFTYNLLYLNQWWLDGGMSWWDTLTAAAALDERLLTLQDVRVDVVTEPGQETARLVQTPDGAPIRVAIAADRLRFEALFLAGLNAAEQDR